MEENKNIFSSILEFIFGAVVTIFYLVFSAFWWLLSLVITVLLVGWVLSWFGIKIGVGF
jgi:VIT1/CCC1 family predicted Fe2+/Mn2+ transporter